MWNPFSKTENVEVNAATSLDTDGWLVNTVNGGCYTSAGQCITNSSALAISTVYDCVRVISEDLAKLPLQIFQDTSTGKVRRREHPLQSVISWQPNPEMSAMSFWNTIVSHSVGWGNGYAEKVRDQNGNIRELWIIPPDRIRPDRDDKGNLFYEVREDDGNNTKVSPDKIFHVPGFGYDGVQGYNPITIARESLGLAAGAEQFGSKFFGNGAKTSLALSFPNSLSEKAYNNLKKSVEQQVSGDSQHRVLLVEEGGKVETMALSQKDSQYLETRQFSVVEICRWFRMPPHKVADLTRATFSNIEEQNIDYVTDTLGSWFMRFEQAIHNQLFIESDQLAGYYVKYNDNALLRGNTLNRFEAYGKAINDGWLTRNEARELEDMNTVDGLDEPLIPLNMQTVTQSEQQTEAGGAASDAFVEDVAGRIALAEERGLSARVDKAEEDRGKFNMWAAKFYAKHADYIEKAVKPLGLSSGNMCDIATQGYNSIFACENPAEHIKTWNRKQEIIDIINEALACTTK